MTEFDPGVTTTTYEIVGNYIRKQRVRLRLDVREHLVEMAATIPERFPPQRIGRRNGSILQGTTGTEQVAFWVYKTPGGTVVVEEVEPVQSVDVVATHNRV